MDRPNIVFIVTDQQRTDTVSAYGEMPYGIRVQTENIDRLARDGMTFTNAYTPCPLCSPARTSFFTGTYPHTHKTLTNTNLHPIDNQIGPEQDVLTGCLKRAGYKLGYVGKWHVNNDLTPLDFGWDMNVGLGEYETFRKECGYEPNPVAKHYETVRNSYGTDPVPVEASRPYFLTDQAIAMMREFASQDTTPFCLRLDFHGPHFPNAVPEPYASMYKPESIKPIPSFYDDMSKKPEVQQIEMKHWLTDTMTWEEWRPVIATYFGEISLIDSQVGRFLRAMDDLGVAETTLVIFTTDHGDLMGAHRIFNKAHTLYEDNTRVPFIARWPGVIQRGSVCDELICHFVDIAPTLMDIAKEPRAEGMHGLSLLPSFKGETGEKRPYVVAEAHGSHMGLYTMRMIRMGNYKYVYHTNGRDEMYDLREDPYEMHNLAESEAHRTEAMKLKRALVEWMKATGDQLYHVFTIAELTGDPSLAGDAPRRGTSSW